MAKIEPARFFPLVSHDSKQAANQPLPSRGCLRWEVGHYPAQGLDSIEGDGELLQWQIESEQG